MHSSPDAQEPVFALLADPATHAGQPVKRIDTHAASVFLAGDRVLKVKRAVRFPFLDYSTAAKRKAACEAELAINLAFAPELYRRVIPITREPDGRLALDGHGEPVEWAVEMRRFDEEATLDRIADRGGIDATLADHLGRIVADVHAAAPIVDGEAWLAMLAEVLDQNEAAFHEASALFAAAAAERLTERSRAAFRRLRPLLQKRARQGRVRRGHGDLHLGNIALINGEPVLFDAIEFDPLIAAGDVLYDLAFLLMDFLHRGLDDSANVVLNRYLAAAHRTDDLDTLAALPLFLSLRAAIRAKVTAARLDAEGTGTQPGIAQAASRYFHLACRLIEPPVPTLVAVGGLSGTGKTLLARALAPRVKPEPGAVIIRSDIERKRRFGVAEMDRLPPEAYSATATAQVYAAMLETAHRVIVAGHSAILDAVFAQAEERDAAAALARRHDVSFHGFFLTADVETRTRRVAARREDASDADVEVARRQEDYAIGDLDWIKIDASGAPEQTIAAATNALP